MKIYIAGPMRGYPEFNFPAFRSAQLLLRAMGHDPVSPHEKDEQVEGFDARDPSSLSKLKSDETMRWDLEQVMICDAIALLPGWEKSQGAQLERVVAESTGKRVFVIDQGVMRPAPAWAHPLIFRWV